MPTNGMNTGVDYALFYVDSDAGIVNLGDVQDVDIKAGHHLLKNTPYNDDPSFAYVEDGYAINFQITRTGSALEDFMVAAAAKFRAGSIVKSGYLQQTIANPDGSISRYQYQNMVIFLTDHGNISRDKTVTLRLEGMASRKVAIN